MFTREEIRYHTLWVRAICCLAVAMGVWNAVYFGVLEPVELLLRDFLSCGAVAPATVLPRAAEIAIVFLVCLVPAAPRIERPSIMVACGAAYTWAYILAVIGVRLTMHRVLPAASALLGILGSTAVLETMAWSEERSRRRQLERIEEVRRQFTDMLVHDLRKRMSSILTSFSLLEKDIQQSDNRVAQLVRTIHAGSERMLILISNLLDIRKTQEGGLALRLEKIQLRDFLDESLNDHRAIGDLVGIGFRLVGDEALAVRADRTIFSRIVTNLLWNALQHAPQGSEIEVGYAPREPGVATVYVANRGDTIPLEERDRIFEAFVASRADSPGHRADSTGLGLAFSKLAIEAHGGAIAIESPWRERGDGVKVVLSVPRHGVPQPRTAV